MPGWAKAASAALIGLAAQTVTSCTEADPASAEFAALCAGALGHYYVEGGKGPEYEATSKRERYWIKRYYSLAGTTDEAARTIVKIGFDLAQEHRKESSAAQNKSMREIMDRCAPYES